MGTASRGSRGHGWLKKYREGLGGRHLQGRYHDRQVSKLVELNNQVFSLNQTSHGLKDEPNMVYLDIGVSGDDKDTTKRIVIELATAALPKTCHNFAMLCKESYAMTKVFRIEKNVGVCFGDYVSRNQDGTEGKCHASVMNSCAPQHPSTFEYEPMVLSHAQKGIVSMLSSGLDKNDSRFIITTVDDAPQLDGRYVAFGRVQQGMTDLEQIALSTFTKKGRPTADLRIVGSGVL
jgi:cyclophilin family peptidyl-prolyl cis-trans isomerase